MKFEGCIQSFMLPWKLGKCQILPVSQNLSLVYFSLAKFQLVSCNPSLTMIWQMTYTHKLPKLCSATLSFQAQKVVAVACYKRWSFTRGCKCKALIGKVLVFLIGGRLWEVVAYERFSFMEGRL